ncbi:MAG: hypothetical protein HQL31_11370 [Planctomycetes bacterium]|nr:hypothetical protein [Planctomycetota bacterium]
MPKYRDKMRLRRLKVKEEVDSFTEYLVLTGYSDEVVMARLEGFVENWEEAVKYYASALERQPVTLGLDSIEFGFDVWIRTELFQITLMAPHNERQMLLQRIERADEILKKTTIETSEQQFDFIENASRHKHWWLFRSPLDAV